MKQFLQLGERAPQSCSPFRALCNLYLLDVNSINFYPITAAQLNDTGPWTCEEGENVIIFPTVGPIVLYFDGPIRRSAVIGCRAEKKSFSEYVVI